MLLNPLFLMLIVIFQDSISMKNIVIFYKEVFVFFLFFFIQIRFSL